MSVFHIFKELRKKATQPAETNEQEFKTIMEYVGKDIKSYRTEENRFILLGRELIDTFKEDNNLSIDMESIVPLIDLYNNDYIVYNKKTDQFQKFNTLDELFYDTVQKEEILKYIDIMNNEGNSNVQYFGTDSSNNSIYNLFDRYSDLLDCDVSIEPATPDELNCFINNYHKYNILDEEISDLLDYYKLNNNVFNYYKCDDIAIFEWYDTEKSLWLGQKDLYTFRYFPKEGKYTIGDASSISFGPDYEFKSITEMLEAFISKRIK